MHGPAVVGWLLAGLMGATGLYCLGRTLRPGATAAERQLDGSEALKGLGMGVMALPQGWGPPVPVGVWVVLFGGAGLWSLRVGLGPTRAIDGGSPGGRDRHHLFHGVAHLAMIYMAVAMAGRMSGMPGTAGTGGMNGMAGMAGTADQGGFPLLTGALLLFFGGHAVLSGVRLIAVPRTDGSPVGGPGGSVPARLLGAAELPQACRMVLGLGMFTMLLTV
jgi:hypothetical protein